MARPVPNEIGTIHPREFHRIDGDQWKVVAKLEITAFKFHIVWPDGSETTEVTANGHAAARRFKYLIRRVSGYALAFRGGTEGLFNNGDGWHRAKSVAVDGNYRPPLANADGTPVLIAGRDADMVLNDYWSAST